MAIPESQLDTWSKQGSVTQSSATYATVKRVLESADAPYVGKRYLSFLQGSYGNDTNIYADSDVDVVMQLSSTYYYGKDNLSVPERVSLDADANNSNYGYSDFKSEVLTHLKKKFGPAVKPGKKAIFIPGDVNRRDTDVLVAVEYRKYLRYRSVFDQQYVEGVCFWLDDGTKTINYPKIHSKNCTAKHQATNM